MSSGRGCSLSASNSQIIGFFFLSHQQLLSPETYLVQSWENVELGHKDKKKKKVQEVAKLQMGQAVIFLLVSDIDIALDKQFNSKCLFRILWLSSCETSQLRHLSCQVWLSVTVLVIPTDMAFHGLLSHLYYQIRHVITVLVHSIIRGDLQSLL